MQEQNIERNTFITRYWICKETISGGAGDIEKGTLLYLEKYSKNQKYLSRLKQRHEGKNVQNRILMHLPPLWNKFIRPATEKETARFFENYPNIERTTNLWQ